MRTIWERTAKRVTLHHLDAIIANDEIVFEPSLPCMDPGLWGFVDDTHSLVLHNAAVKAARLPDEVVTWSEALQNEGVATGALINEINLTSTFNFDQGYDTFIWG